MAQEEQVSDDNMFPELNPTRKLVRARIKELMEQRQRREEESFYSQIPAEQMEAKKRSAKQASPRMIRAYIDGKTNNLQNTDRMNREEMMEFEKLARQGDLAVPPGIIVEETKPAGLFETAKEMVTGEERATARTNAAKDWAYLPELEDLGKGAGTLTKLAIMSAEPEEAASMIKANFPNVEVTRDERNNIIFRSGKTGEEYAIKPGIQPSDVFALGVRTAVTAPAMAIGGVGGAALARALPLAARATPLIGGAMGRVAAPMATATGQAIAGGAAGAVAEETAVQAAQAAVPGGRFDEGQVLAAGAVGGALPLAAGPAGAMLQAAARPVVRAAEPVVEAGRRAIAPAVEAGREALVAGREAVEAAARPYALSAQMARAAPEVAAAAPTPAIVRPVAEALPEPVRAARRAADDELSRALAGVDPAQHAAYGYRPGAPVATRALPDEISPSRIASAAPVVRETVEQVAPVRAAIVQAVPDASAETVDDIVRLTKDVPLPNEELADLILATQKRGQAGEIARIQLAEMMHLNVEDAATARAYGFDVADEYFIDNPRMRALAGMEASQSGSQAEAILKQTVGDALDRSREILRKFDAQYSGEGVPTLGRVSDDIRNMVVSQRAQMKEQAQALYREVDAVMKDRSITFDNTKKYFKQRLTEVSPDRISREEKDLRKFIESAIYHKYGDLESLKRGVIQALEKNSGAFNNFDTKVLYDLKTALTADQMDNVARLAGDEMRRNLRKAHLLTVGQKGLEKRIVKLFGKDFVDGMPTGDIAGELVSAIIEPKRAGGVSKLRKLIKMVPEEKRREALATAFAQAVQTGDGISPAKFISVKRALDNSQFADEFYKYLGEGSKESLDAVGKVMKRMYLAESTEMHRTGKAMQRTLEEAIATRAMNRLFNASVSRSIAGGIGAATGGAAGSQLGIMIGKPGFGAATGAAAGAALATNFVQSITSVAGINRKLVKLIRDENFQKMMVESAKKGTAPSEQTIQVVAKTQAFKDYADELGLPEQPQARASFLRALFATQAVQAARRRMDEERRQTGR